MHEVIHGRAAGVPMGEVKVAVALVVVAWEETRWQEQGSPEGSSHPRGIGRV